LGEIKEGDEETAVREVPKTQEHAIIKNEF
jgi:hypothetical protein